MARILIGWELGANRGHIAKIEPLAERLLAEGHEVSLALQQPDSIGIAPDPRLEIWQAPIWSRLLTSGVQPYVRAVATMGDILCRLGLDKPGGLAALVRAWDRIFSSVDPHLVIADFAPAMLVAARGRIASLQTGTGYACPPFEAPAFPKLVETANAYDESEILDIVDADLRSVGREPLPALPALFASDHSTVVSFPVLDPYASWRREPYCTPVHREALAARAGSGDEVFVYFYHQVGSDTPVWEGLAKSGRKVRVHVTDARPEHVARCKQLGLIFEPKPLSNVLIAERSRMALSHGGHGFVAACLVAGLPQLVGWYDLEKRLHGRAIEDAGLGEETNLFDTSADVFAAIIDRVYDDEEQAARSRAAATDLAELDLDTPEDRIAQVAASA